MRDTIDFGIDLGTTNSAVAVVENGRVEVIKNEDQSEITPSAVWLPSLGAVHVGLAAKNEIERDPESVAVEFKLRMGLIDAEHSFANAGVRLTPQQLSAEVLKSLRGDAEVRFGEPPEAAVITVPAAFALNQNNATSEAATLAGFSAPCPLLQEPTAAAFAFGYEDISERAYWMVFDFGGGTFDAAMVSKRDGELQVLNHAGDPYLGGKLIDWTIVDRLIAPAVSADLGFAAFRRDNPLWRVNFAKLKGAVEKAKIQLSRRETVEVKAHLFNADGGYEPFSYPLRRGEVDQLAEPFYLRAINCCRDALTEGGVKPDGIDRLLLVGGVTLSPGLRELLADPQRGLGIRLDFSQDPSTVVARGAALFARTVRLERPAATPRPGEFVADLSYDPTVTTTTPLVAGWIRGAAAVDWTGYSVSLHNPDGRPPFHSARIGLSAEGAFGTEVVVAENATSKFTVELVDAAGHRQLLTPDTLSITHGDIEFRGAVVPTTIGIGTAENSFVPMLRKGAPLPARFQQKFETSIALRRSDAESLIRIPVVEGERPRTDRNFQVAMLEIRPRDVRIDLPAGSDVLVTFEIDSSRLVTVVADVPAVRAQFEAEIDLDNLRAPEPEELAARLREVEDRLVILRAEAANEPSAVDRLNRLEQEGGVGQIEEQVRAAWVDRDAALAAERQIRNQQAALDDVEDAVRLPALINDLERALNDCAEQVARTGRQEHRQELDELRRRGDDVIRSRNQAAVRKQLDRTLEFLVDLLRTSPDWPVVLFDGLCTRRSVMPAMQADQLIQEGERAIAAGDWEALTAVNERLRRLIPPDDPDPVGWLTPRR